jgi:SAM-dependent methyltransferase
MDRLAIYRFLKRHIAPNLTHSQRAYRDALLAQLETRPRWLDLGCGHEFTPDWAWVPEPELLALLPRMVGVDGDFSSIRRHQLLKGRVLGNIEALPFAPASFDLVTANMVMEHVGKPESVLREVRRILAPNGVFLFHTPNLAYPLVFAGSLAPQWLKNALISFLEVRTEDDIYPTRYKINTPAKAACLGSAAGFQVESCRAVASDALTGRLGPLAVFELLWINATQWKALAGFRTDLIAVFRKPESVQEQDDRAANGKCPPPDPEST